MSIAADPRGYYALLGVTPDASAEEIKCAFRKKAKLLHPDHNQETDAGSRFQAITEAYHNLSNPTIRASYDAQRFSEEMDEPVTAHEAHEAHAQPEAHGLDVAPVVCSRCGHVTAQPRYIIFWQVISYIFLTMRYPVQGVFCRKCADRTALIASFKTWLFGWWGFPWGPPYALDALLRNIRGGDMPVDANAHLLRHQAFAFFLEQKFALSRDLIAQAMTFARGDMMLRQKLMEIQNAMPGEARIHHRLKRRWHTITWATLLQTIPLLVLAGTFLWLILK
ncbi:MAG TPA: hypothetical protein DCW68_06170 [Rhodospirillaceae bacterium]|nr:MAG: hypothetical protein A2018_03735 [Alphaproteobacteria bacterium GWF2_58_20]HAU29675.1 hypothetical protein [Rhodospirillaceae bacterium]